MSKYTLVTKTHDFVEYFLANDLFLYKCIKFKLNCEQLSSGQQNVRNAFSICRVEKSLRPFKEGYP